MKLIDRTELLSGLADKTGCSVKEYQDALDTMITTINGQNICSSNIAISDPYYSHSVITTTYAPVEDRTSFTCPYCGTHYIARDPGFVPNCHNCGAIMRKE